MAIAIGKTVTLSEDGESDWVRLVRAKNRLLLSSESWNGSMCTVEYSDDAETVYGLSELSFGAMPVQKNYALDINGLFGYARIVVLNYGGSPVVMKVFDPERSSP